MKGRKKEKKKKEHTHTRPNVLDLDNLKKVNVYE